MLLLSLVVSPSVLMSAWSAESTEAEVIADAFKRVASGESREVVLVSGEAGLGKTTLVAEAVPRRLRLGGIASSSATARRIWPPPTNSSPKHSGTLSHTLLKSSFSPTSMPTAPNWHEWSRP